jgi:hypothetical protein
VRWRHHELSYLFPLLSTVLVVQLRQLLSTLLFPVALAATFVEENGRFLLCYFSFG